MNEAAGAISSAAVASVAPTATASAIPTDKAPPKSLERRMGLPRIDFSGKLRIRRTGEKEALLLTLVCALDMYSTLWWVLTGRAHEANKLLAWTFQIDPMLFVIVKCASCLPALLLAPLLAQRHPKFTVILLRCILLAYFGSYIVGVYVTSFR